MAFALAATVLALAAAGQDFHPPEQRPPVDGPVALATGDSMMQVIERPLDARLEGLGLPTVLDSRVGTGISRPALLDWVPYASVQAVEIHAEVTLVFLGASDFLPFSRHARCCGDAWVAVYSRRVRHMVRAWLRGGAGRVYWMTLPAPRSPDLDRVFRAVNRAMRRAVASSPPAEIVDLAEVFTPGWRFRASMPRGGHRVRVRMADGVHLNQAGAEIASGVVVRALRADGVLR